MLTLYLYFPDELSAALRPRTSIAARGQKETFKGDDDVAITATSGAYQPPLVELTTTTSSHDLFIHPLNNVKQTWRIPQMTDTTRSGTSSARTRATLSSPNARLGRGQVRRVEVLHLRASAARSLRDSDKRVGGRRGEICRMMKWPRLLLQSGLRYQVHFHPLVKCLTPLYRNFL